MKILRIVYGIIFLILSGVVIYYSVYFIWLYAMGVGWSGKEISNAEFLWEIKAPILISVFSVLSCVGLFFNKKWGSLFGLALCFSALFFYCEATVSGIGSGFIDTTAGLSGYVASILLIFVAMVGVLKLLNAYGKLNFTHYATIGFVASSVLISYYTMFP